MHTSRFILASAILAVCAAQLLSASNLQLRYSFDSVPGTDGGAFVRGAPTVAGTPTSVVGKFNNGTLFNPNGAQTDLYFTAGDWSFVAPLTISSFFSIDQLVITQSDPNNSYMKIISQKNNFDDAQGLELQYNVGNKQWSVILPGNNVYNTPALANQYVANQFHHVAVTVTNTQVTLYLDGVQYDTKAFGAVGLNGNSGKNVTVGGSANGATVNGGGAWHGALDELRVYNVELSAQQIQSLYNGTDLVAATTSSTTTSSTSSTTTSSTATSSSNTDAATTTSTFTTVVTPTGTSDGSRSTFTTVSGPTGTNTGTTGSSSILAPLFVASAALLALVM